MCLTTGIGSSERAQYLKALEAIVNLLLHRWYKESWVSLFLLSFEIKLAHKFDDSEPVT